ncbi:MAG: DNA polymerase III subunit gamma/tau [Saprospiraceae bacterium]|nr:DNA polymerase III subunit gamma/tau [Saprospiraceae bacterium]
MSNFVVSARKYRPARFEDVVGQEHVSRTLKNALQSGQVAHAFLFCGPRGVGKTTCARILAKVLNCQHVTKDFEPCNTCDACKAFSENASFNITELDAASNNSVEHIRALIEQVRFQPQQGKYKVYIIDEVHMLSQQAFNAFLKTLEEPPPYAIFILATTEKHKIIPTILSRCQIYDFRRIQPADMVKHLQGICSQEGIDADPDALHIIAQKADGALRDALSIFDRMMASASNKRITYDDVISNLNVLDYDYYFQVVDALLLQDASKVMLLFDDILKKGFDPDLFINGLAEHLRNLLVCKDEQTLVLLEVSDNLRERYRQQAAICPTTLLLTGLNIANDCDIEYKMARNKRLHVEMALIKMTFIMSAVPAGKAAPVGTPVEMPEKKTTDARVAAPKSDNQADISAPPAPAVPDTPISDSPAPASPAVAAKGAEKHAMTKVNLADMLEEANQAAQEEVRPREPLTPERARAAWDAYVSQVDKSSIRAILQVAEIEVEAHALAIKVGTRVAESTLRNEASLTAFLRQELDISDLNISIARDEKLAAVEAPKRAKPLTVKERFLLMSETNPNVRELQKRFDLRPDED